MEQAIMWVMAIGAVIGGVDRIFGNRLGLGKKFDEGFHLMGPTALSMVGVLCLAPLLSMLIENTIAPLCIRMGFDPGLFGGILALDMGGYQLAKELAQDVRVGRYAGILVGALLGCTVTFTIPVGMGMLGGEDRPHFARGVLFGMIAMPAALLAGAMICGLSLTESVWQSLPILILSALLLLGIWKCTEKMIRGFGVFAKIIEIATIIGLVLGAVKYMTGVTIVPGLAPIEEGMAVVASIAIVLLGSLPMAELLQRALKKPLGWAAKKVGMNETSVAAMLIGLVAVVPAIAMFKGMDRRGKVVVAAIFVCGASTFAGHLGFTAGVDPTMIVPLLATKMLGSAVAALIALYGTRNMKETE